MLTNGTSGVRFDGIAEKPLLQDHKEFEQGLQYSAKEFWPHA